MNKERTLKLVSACRVTAVVPLLALALLFGVRGGGVAEAATAAAPAQLTMSAGSDAAPPVLDDWDDHHCDRDHDGDDWGCRFYREHHQCDGDHDRDDWFCGWDGH